VSDLPEQSARLTWGWMDERLPPSPSDSLIPFFFFFFSGLIEAFMILTHVNSTISKGFGKDLLLTPSRLLK
jgi:hypothetical protein